MRGRGDEFLSRNRQEPADLDQTQLYGRSEQSRVDVSQTPLGSPPADCDVRSTYDTRPINAFDFNIPVLFQFQFETPEQIFFEFQVDEGYVAVLRSFSHWFEPAPVLPRSGVKFTLFINGTSQLHLIDIPVGVESDNRIPLHTIADEFNTVRGSLFIDPDDFPGFDMDVWMIFYGNYLLKTNVPANQQIANCRGEFPTRTPPAPRPVVPRPPPLKVPDPSPIPPPPPAIQRQVANDLCPIQGRGGKVTYGPCPTRGLIRSRT